MGDEVIKVLNDLCDKFGIAIDWSSENVLPYLEQLGARLIRWTINTSIMWLVIGIILIAIAIGGIFFAKYAWKQYKKYDPWETSWDDITIGVVAVTIILFVTGLIMVLVQTHDIITCMSFPEHVLVRYISNYL